MITHTIKFAKKLTEVAAAASTKSNWPWTGRQERAQEEGKAPWWTGALAPSLRPLSKLEYAQYLHDLDVQKGDIMIHTHHVESDLFPDKEVCFFYEVTDIQELHAHVDYHLSADRSSHEPKCLWMRQLDGHGRQGFFACPGWWTKVPKDKYPPKLAAWLKERDNADPLHQIS